MGGSPFQAFAERHDLDFAPRVAPGVGPIPSEGIGEVAGGALPGGLEGFVARYAQRVKPKFLEDSSLDPTEAGQLRRVRISQDTTHYFRDCCLLVTRVPESTVFLPYVTCRDDVVRGFTDRMVGPGGLIPLVEHVEFESIELNRRYRIGMFKGTSANRLRQLFSPTLIDWMASTAPDGLYFELFGGVLSLTVTTGKIDDIAQIERVCELATHVSERIRAESTETMGDDGVPEFTAPPEQLESERKRAENLAAAAFTSPPADFEKAFERIEPVVKGKSKGLLRKVFKSIDQSEATSLALEALVRGYGERHGLVWQRPADFTGRNADLPYPIAPTQALRGPLPVLGVEGDLFIHGGASVTRESPCSPGATLPGFDPVPTLVVAPDAEPQESRMTIGGFQVAATGGGRRVSEQSRQDAEASAALAEELGGRFRVIAQRCEPGRTLTPAMKDWLLAGGDEGGSMLVRAGGTLVVVSSPVPAQEWSTATLDGFCESLAPLRPA